MSNRMNKPKEITIRKSKATESDFQNQLAEALEELFPKGKCKERGRALVLYAQAVLLFKRFVISLEKSRVAMPDPAQITNPPVNDLTNEVKKNITSNYADDGVDTTGVNRVEVISSNGREYVNWKENNKVRLLFQDNGRTLKVVIAN